MAFSPKKKYFITIFTDITEHIETEENLRDALENLRETDKSYRLLSKVNQSMLKATSESMLLEDVCEVITRVGEYSLAWIGYLNEEHERKLDIKASKGDDRGILSRIVRGVSRGRSGWPCRRAIDNEQRITIRGIEGRPQEEWARIYTHYGYNSASILPIVVKGEMEGILGIYSERSDAFSDAECNVISELSEDLAFGIEILRTRREKRNLRRKLQKESRLLEAIINSTADGLLVLNDDRNILYYNQRFRELWNAPDDFSEFTPINQLLEHMSKQAAKPTPLFDSRAMDVSENGDVNIIYLNNGRILECFIHTLKLDGIDLGQVWSFTDVTPIVKSRNRAELYLDLLTHDMSNALQGLHVGIDLIEIDEDTVRNVKPALNKMREALSKCTRIISKVHGLSGIENEELKSMSLTDAIEESVKAMKERFPNTRFFVNVPQDTAMVTADRYLNDLLMNLLENAVEHNDSEQPTVILDLKKCKDSFELSIADNGPGIQSHERSELFNPERRFGGVGLHLVAQILDKYNGDISIENRIANDFSKGAKFVVRLPAANH